MVNVRKTPEHPDASTKGMDVMVRYYPSANHVTDKGTELYWLDVQALQIEGANPHLPPQTQPHLHMATDAEQRVSTGVPYTKEQVEAIFNTAGQKENHFGPMQNQQTGEQTGAWAMVKADVMFPRHKDSSTGKMVARPPIINTKSLEPASVEIPAGMDVPTEQFEAVQAHREAKKQRQAAEAQAVEPKTAEAQTPQAQMEETPQAAAPQAANPGMALLASMQAAAPQESTAPAYDEPDF